MLVVRFMRGDRDAFTLLLERHFVAIYCLASQVCGSTYAEKIMQDVFLRFWQDPEWFKAESGSVRTSLLTDTHRRAVAVLRSNGFSRSDIVDRSQTGSAGTEADETAHAPRHGNQVTEGVLALLANHQRDAVRLAYFGGYTYQEVAGLLKQPAFITKRRIRSGLHRARSELTSRA